MARVFLSYARENVGHAQELAEAIGSAGHQVWWDRHVHGGLRFADEIDRELKDAEVVVVLWSANSVGSAWVQDEATEGRDSGRWFPSRSTRASRAGLSPVSDARPVRRHCAARIRDPRRALHAIASTAGEDAPATATKDPRTADPGRQYSICVLPFANMSGDFEQEYFSDGISEDIITDLTKVSALSVVARNTAFPSRARPCAFPKSPASSM